MKYIGAFVAVALGVLAVCPYIIPGSERVVLDDSLRSQMVGKQFIQLSDGVTHYQWAGPENGPVVVLVHGFSSPSFIWNGQFHTLAEEGFRVLRYDQFGRGLSDRPNIRYDDELYDRQLLELLDAFGIQSPVDLVGLSMGGATTIRFTDHHPERVRRFVLIAPAGFGVELPVVVQLLRIPGLSSWLMRVAGDFIIQRSIDQMASENLELARVIRKEYADQMQYKGYKRALLSTLLHNPLQGLDPVYGRVGKLKKPCALFWGDDDRIVPFDQHKKVQEHIQHIAFHAVPGAGHVVPLERPDLINPPLIAFLKAQGGS